jgi:hypothetical protein
LYIHHYQKCTAHHGDGFEMASGVSSTVGKLGGDCRGQDRQKMWSP